SHLWRQKTPQPAHALDFVHLVGDALFELLVEFHQLLGLRFYLLCSLAQFVEQPRILDCDDGLSGEVRQQLDLFIREGLNLVTVDAYDAVEFVVFDERHYNHGANATNLHRLHHSGITLDIRLSLRQVGEVDGPARSHHHVKHAMRGRTDWRLCLSFS